MGQCFEPLGSAHFRGDRQKEGGFTESSLGEWKYSVLDLGGGNTRVYLGCTLTGCALPRVFITSIKMERKAQAPPPTDLQPRWGDWHTPGSSGKGCISRD